MAQLSAYLQRSQHSVYYFRIRVPESARKLVPQSQIRTSPKLSVALAQYLEAQRLEGVGAKTIGDKRSIVELLVRAVGDMPVHRFQRQHAQQFREIALKLPPRSNRQHHVPLERLIADAVSTISTTTFNNYEKYLSAFFAWLVLEGHCDKNPFEGLRITGIEASIRGAQVHPSNQIRITLLIMISVKNHTIIMF